MKHYWSCIIYSSIIWFYCGFSGCIDDPVNPDTTKISGKIYEGILFNKYLISPGEYPIVSNDRNGMFHLEIPGKPYDLIISENLYYGENSTVKYTNITNSMNYFLIEPDFRYVNSDNLFPNKCSFQVEYPEPENSNTVLIKFASEDYFSENQTNYGRVTIALPEDKSSISGKLIYFEGFPDEQGGFYRCDKFGIKEITLYEGDNSTIVFDPAEINYDPVEIFSYVNISLPLNFSFNSSYISLSIPGYSACSDLIINYLRFQNQYVSIPILNHLGFKIKVHSIYTTTGGLGDIWQYFDAQSNINLMHQKTFDLLTPADEEINISDSTTFEISDNSTLPAICGFNLIYGWNKTARVYTNKRSIKFSDFRSWNLSFLSGTSYLWSVRKFPNFNSVDEFLSTPYIINKNFSHVESVKNHIFKTKP
jgi:hypothetical protein